MLLTNVCLVARLVHSSRQLGRVNQYILLTLSAGSFSLSLSTETDVALGFVPDWGFELLVADTEPFLRLTISYFAALREFPCVDGSRRQVDSRVSRGFRAAWTQVSLSVRHVSEKNTASK